MKITNSIDLQDILSVVTSANQAVIAIYNNSESLNITYKSDKSPLTKADTESHAILSKGLSALDSTIPVVSEEQTFEENEKSKKQEYYWLIDPIDGTKEFISRVGQFTICVALMKNGHPVFGVVCAPALDELYYGGKEFGSYKVGVDGKEIALPAMQPMKKIYGSASNTNEPTRLFIESNYQNYEIEPVGSQLKFTYVAEGKAMAYPRIGTDMKLWDIAAGHAIVEGAGGVVERPDGTSIDYNDPDFLAGDFVAKIS